jgi:hypothetical protein
MGTMLPPAHRQMRSAGRQASNLERGVRIGVTWQNIRSRAPWTTILAAARTSYYYGG